MDPYTGATIDQDEYPEQEMTALALSPDESLLAIGYEGGRLEVRAFPDLAAVIWHTGTRYLDPGPGRPPSAIIDLAFGEDGLSLMALTVRGATGSWRAASGERLSSRSASDIRTLMALDDGRIVTGSSDGVLTIGDGDASHSGTELRGHRAQVTAMRAAGNRLVTASMDGTIRFWDLRLGVPIGRPIEADGSFIDMSDDGKWLAVVSDVGVGIWNLDPTTWTDAACRVAGRNLTQAEWDSFLPSDERYHATCPQFASA